MTLSEGPQGQDELGRDPQRGEGSEWTAILKESTFAIFQVALARRRVEDTMQAGDLASILHWRELTFVHTVLSDVHGLLRRMMKHATANGFTWNEVRPPADGVGQAGEPECGDRLGG